MRLRWIYYFFHIGLFSVPAELQRASRYQAFQCQRVEVDSSDRRVQVTFWFGQPYSAQAKLLVEPNSPIQRWYIDIPYQKKLPDLKFLKKNTGEKTLISNVRMAWHKQKRFRIVFELKKPIQLESQWFKSPTRLIWKMQVADSLKSNTSLKIKDKKTQYLKKNSIQRVVIDPGHGGHDTGAIGSSGVQEKDVVLSISQYIAPYLQKYGIQTFYTRNKDIYLSLEERTLYANQMRADVFVSVHANSALRKQACGIETYYLNTTSDEYSLRLASLENKGSNKPISALKFILTDLSLQASSQESYRLALQVQKLMVKEAKRIEPKIHDLGVKPSLFYVLLGAKMPAILVETAFISNAQEEKLLTQAAYQRLIAKAIALAIVDYSRASLTIAHPFKQ